MNAVDHLKARLAEPTATQLVRRLVDAATTLRVTPHRSTGRVLAEQMDGPTIDEQRAADAAMKVRAAIRDARRVTR
mgnify:FL=1